MTTRWKRLTALMLILLTLLNAGSALAAEEFWKWGGCVRGEADTGIADRSD